MTAESGTMLAAAVRALLLRDLRGLRRELDAYPDDASVWTLAPGISNATGTLVLHVVGNLRHFLGAVLGSSGYVRDRDAEFSRRDVTRIELERELEAAIRTVESVLPSLTEEELARIYPVQVGGRHVRTSDFLVHLVAHLDYHLGQVDYHRRLITGGAAIDTVSLAELPSARE
jgi:uncharacterized damage-inducible protein DinB